MKSATKSYLEKVALLSTDEQERLLSRMTGKLPKRFQKEKLSRDEAIAIQLELEDEQLQEWREKMVSLQAQAEKAQAKASKKAEKEKLEIERKAKLAEEKLAKKNAAKLKKAKDSKSNVTPIEAAVPTLVPKKD